MTPGGSAILVLDRVGMVFDGSDGRNPVLEDVSLEIQEHDFTAIVGESGCGKTTLLRIMAGLQRPTAGEVRLEGAPVTGPGPRVCLVFQNYGATLLPWKSALENVVFGLRALRGEGCRVREAGMSLLEGMGLADAAHRYPWELSGGMQQRVALARALIRKPRLLLLDEPFSSVDEPTRAALQELLRLLHRNESCSIVLVSHNLEEVLNLSRSVVVLGSKPARIQRIIENPQQLSRDALRSALAKAPDQSARAAGPTRTQAGSGA